MSCEYCGLTNINKNTGAQGYCSFACCEKGEADQFIFLSKEELVIENLKTIDLANKNDVVLYEFAKEAEERITRIFDQETKGDPRKVVKKGKRVPNLTPIAKIVFIYRFFALRGYDPSTMSKGAYARSMSMKILSINMLLDMLDNRKINKDQVERYLHDWAKKTMESDDLTRSQTLNKMIDMTKYICSYCHFIGALMECGRCQRVKYCTLECSISDRPNHHCSPISIMPTPPVP